MEYQQYATDWESSATRWRDEMNSLYMWVVRGEVDGHTIAYSGRLTRSMSGVPICIHSSHWSTCRVWTSQWPSHWCASLGETMKHYSLYGPTTAATEEEMVTFYLDLSQAVKQVSKGDMLLAVGDFNVKVSRREMSAMSSAVGLYGLAETNEAGEQLEDFCSKHELALANTTFRQHPRRLYNWTSPDGDTQNLVD